MFEEKIDEGVLRWFGHVERMESDRIAKRVYVGRLGEREKEGPERLFFEMFIPSEEMTN